MVKERVQFDQLAPIPFVCAFILCIQASSRAEPTIHTLQESTNPTLVQARALDVKFVEPEKADQEAAEALYLRFVRDHPESDLVPFIYFHLGHMYQDYVDPEWPDALGHKRDNLKARQFFLQAVRAHPADKISVLLISTVQIRMAACK